MAADSRTAVSRDPVHQFSIFSENRVGRLHDLAALLKKYEVHIMAMTTLDTTDSAIVRIIVDDPDNAREILVNNDFAHAECAVLAVELPDESHLSRLLGALFEAEINIHYVYPFLTRPEGRSAMVINAEDIDVAAEALNTRGLRVLTQRDIAR